MNKLKIFIFKIIFSLILFSGSSYAKNIPPGSGIGDVPANILILLDKSGSMSAVSYTHLTLPTNREV